MLFCKNCQIRIDLSFIDEEVKACKNCGLILDIDVFTEVSNNLTETKFLPTAHSRSFQTEYKRKSLNRIFREIKSYAVILNLEFCIEYAFEIAKKAYRKASFSYADRSFYVIMGAFYLGCKYLDKPISFSRFKKINDRVNILLIGSYAKRIERLLDFDQNERERNPFNYHIKNIFSKITTILNNSETNYDFPLEDLDPSSIKFITLEALKLGHFINESYANSGYHPFPIAAAIVITSIQSYEDLLLSKNEILRFFEFIEAPASTWRRYTTLKDFLINYSQDKLGDKLDKKWFFRILQIMNLAPPPPSFIQPSSFTKAFIQIQEYTYITRLALKNLKSIGKGKPIKLPPNTNTRSLLLRQRALLLKFTPSFICQLGDDDIVQLLRNRWMEKGILPKPSDEATLGIMDFNDSELDKIII